MALDRFFEVFLLVMCIPGQWICSLWVSGWSLFGKWRSHAQSVSVFEPTSNLLVVLWTVLWPLTAFLRSFCCDVYSRSLDLWSVGVRVKSFWSIEVIFTVCECFWTHLRFIGGAVSHSIAFDRFFCGLSTLMCIPSVGMKILRDCSKHPCRPKRLQLNT